MPRPCNCNNVPDTPTGYTSSVHCNLCTIWVHQPDSPAARAWKGLPIRQNPLLVPPPPPPRHVLPCVHEGAILEFCTTKCRQEARHVRDCDIHDRCTRIKVGSKLHNCEHCPDYNPAVPSPTLLFPRKLHEVDASKLSKGRSGWAFNAGLLRYKDRLLLCYRTDWAGSRCHIAELGEDYNVLNTTQLSLPHARAMGGQEDPRLFVYREQLHIAYIGVERGRTSQLYARLTDDHSTEAIYYPEPTNYRRQEPKEKNWSFFDYEGHLMAVYETGPRHTIITVDRNRAELLYDTPVEFPWSGGFIRGGAPPVRVGDLYYHWFHGRVGTDQYPWYNMGLSVFEAKPPFKTVAFSAHPLLWGDMNANLKTDRSYACTAFPCGAVLDNDTWKIGMGWNDRRIMIAEWNAADVDAEIGLNRLSHST